MNATANLKTVHTAGKGTSPISVSWHSNLDSLPDATIEGWRDLTDHGPYGEPFFQPEWFTAYARAFLKTEHSQLLLTYSGERLTGVLPLVRRNHFFGKIPARTLSGLSGIHSCRFDLIHDRTQSPIIASSMWKSIKANPDWVVLELLDVPENGGCHRILQEALVDGFLGCTWSTRRMPFMKIQPQDPFSNCPTASRTFRHRLASKNRKLADPHPVTLRAHSDLNQGALENFLSLERQGWKGLNKSAVESSEQTLLFYRTIAQEAAHRGYLKIYSLEQNGTPIAMHLGLQMQDCYYAPKVAYDEKLARYSPGQLLVERVIKDLSSQSVTTYDFLGPSAPWKRIWTLSARPHHNIYIFRPTVTGRFLHAAIAHGASQMRRVKYAYFGDPQG